MTANDHIQTMWFSAVLLIGLPAAIIAGMLIA